MRYDDMQDGALPYLLGAAVIVVLLMVLHQVVRDAVRQGALIKISYAERAETNWRCNAAHGVRARQDCIDQRTSAMSEDTNQLLVTADMRKP
jgi:hypothetical protein